MAKITLKQLGICLSLILLVVALDQASKYWIYYIVQLPLIGKVEISSIFDLTLVWNQGVSFGALKAHADWQRWGLVALTSVIALFFSSWMISARNQFTARALALVIGGAIGNMIDRIQYGAVLDFLDFSGLHFPWVFNVADSAVTLGAILLVWDMLKHPDEPPQSKQNPEAQSQEIAQDPPPTA
jgi:signal peptidase II